MIEDDEIQLSTTLSFKQQKKASGNTVPDGLIEQESFKIVIETKPHGNISEKQLIGHSKAFNNENSKVLMLIAKEPISEKVKRNISKSINEHAADSESTICFVATTFKVICHTFRNLLNDYDIEMRELIDDYELYCEQTKLIDNTDTKMRVVLSGETFEQNMDYNIYYNPRSRGYQNTRYLGLYKKKAVRAIGELIAIADVDISGDRIDYVEEIEGNLTQEMKDSIVKVVEEARKQYGYKISKNHRFFFVEEFYETEFKKKSKGGLMGQRYIDLKDPEGCSKLFENDKENVSTSQIAEILKTKECGF